MASKSQKFVYALQAVYEGKNDMAQLSGDLKSLGQIESFQKLQGDFTSTTTALVAAKARMRDLKSEMKKPGGEAFATEYKNATASVSALSAKLQKQKQKLDDSRQSMQTQGFQMNDLAGQYRKLAESTELHGQKIAAMRTLGVQSFASIDRKVQELHAAYKILEKDPSIAARELAAAKRKMKADIASLTGETGKWASKIDKVKMGFAGLAGLTVGGYLLGNMVQKTGDAARELQNLARVAGTSVEELSATGFATQFVGISVEKLADISKDAKDKIGDFIENGGGEFKDFFDNVAPKVGLTAQELIKMSGPDCLVAIKKALDDANISADNQVFYLEALANDASLLTPLLEDNGRAMKEKAQRARELNLSISDMDNAKLVEMAEKTKELTDTGGALTREIVSALAPSLQFLMGQVQDVVAWFNQLDPGIQRIIVLGATGTAIVAGLGAAFFPLVSSISMGLPLLSSLALGFKSVATGANVLAIASRVLGVAVKGILPVGIIFMIYEIGKAMGIWTPIMNAVQRGAISLTAGIHLLGLNIRRLWNVISGDDAEVVALDKRIEKVGQMYDKLSAKVGEKQEELVDSAKASQKKVTAEIEKGATDQVAIVQDAVKKMSDAYAGAASGALAQKPGEKGSKKRGSKKKGKEKEEKIDAFGFTETENKDSKKQLAIADAIKSGDMTGYKKKKKDDGTWAWEADEKAKPKKDTSPKKVYGKNGKWDYHYGDDTGLKKRKGGGYEREEKAKKESKKKAARSKSALSAMAIDSLRNHSAGLKRYSYLRERVGIKLPAGDSAAMVSAKIDKLAAMAKRPGSRLATAAGGEEAKKIVELKLGKAKVQGSQSDVDSFIEELKRAGTLA
ncbi:hypothetical protein [Desulfotalea psychrophila]|uniref:Uncharacterized protein n=1 Tax=Desulfotalea psychrophila (strain LSv54 / DSM 12343) TaxID=177439 RepID=Q6AMV4_DESPS|nr:hypothetical protein [Desulfotalea psychrophila]CAG36320.1 hypothetical protein DP1591 [Desulfotalea psychrophila LSv54]